MEVRSKDIVYLNPADLTPYPFNARKHEDWQIAQLSKIIQEVGYIDPVIIDEEGTVLAGHARVMAALRLNMPHVPVVRIEGLSAQQKRKYVLAANKIAENAGWDQDLLKGEIVEIFKEDQQFDFSVLGFGPKEIDKLLESIKDIAIDTTPDHNDLPGPEDKSVNKTQYQFLIKCEDQSQLFKLRDMLNVTRSSVTFDKFMEFINARSGAVP